MGADGIDVGKEPAAVKLRCPYCGRWELTIDVSPLEKCNVGWKCQRCKNVVALTASDVMKAKALQCGREDTRIVRKMRE